MKIGKLARSLSAVATAALLAGCLSSGGGSSSSSSSSGGQPLPPSPPPPPPGALAGQHFFQGNNGAADSEQARQLWITDGTSAGTQMVWDIYPGNNPEITEKTYFGERMFFFARDNAQRALWVSDGTAAGTRIFHETPSSGFGTLFGLRVVGPRLYFWADSDDGSARLWHVGVGDDAATMLPGPSPFRTETPVAAGSILYFLGEGTAGRQVWRTDGTPEGTWIVSSLPVASSNPEFLTVAGNFVYYVASSGGVRALWRSDDSEESMEKVVDISGQFGGMAAVGDTLYFVLAPETGANSQLWRSDGTAAGTTALTAEPSDVRLFFSTPPAALDGLLYFVADDGASGWELWRSNGTVGGTFMVADIWPGEGGSTPHELTVMDGTLYFAAANGDATVDGDGIELWRSNGTEAGTQMVINVTGKLWPGSLPRHLRVRGSRLFYTAHEDDTGREPWVSDGTGAGTSLILDVCPGFCDGAGPPLQFM